MRQERSWNGVVNGIRSGLQRLLPSMTIYDAGHGSFSGRNQQSFQDAESLSKVLSEEDFEPLQDLMYHDHRINSDEDRNDLPEEIAFNPDDIPHLKVIY